MHEQKINRRDFLSKTIYGSMAAGAMLYGCSDKKKCGDKKQPAEKRPNIIFILTDDQRWDTLGCMGNTIIKTPTIDSMAKEGVLFANAFVTSSICMTSRASILTGQYARRHHINAFYQNLTAAALSQTYPLLLRSAGYRTGLVGKYGVGTEELPSAFDVWHGIPGPGQPVYESIDKNGRHRHLTEVITEQSVDFLNGCSDKQPFCLSIGYKAPHVQELDSRVFVYEKEYREFYKNDHIPEPKTATEKHFDVLPDFLKRSEARLRWKERFATPEMYQESVKGYYRLITGVDDSIKAIREQLRVQGLDKNTVIIFTSDNGFFLGEHGLTDKWFAYEESIRVPLIVYDPRLKPSQKGKRCEDFALNIDIAPTILDIAGVTIPTTMQGVSLMPLARGGGEGWRTDFFYEHLFDLPPIPKSEGVRNKKFKYIRYIDQRPVYEELYDLENDPYEERNCASKSEYGETLATLRKRCDAFRDSLK
jgi:arylsulfatase A-like enzyme